MKTINILAALVAFLVFATPSQADTHYSIDKVIDNLVQIESNGKANALGDWTKVKVMSSENKLVELDYPRAVGILQIHPVMIKEANRILGKEVFTVADRLNPIKSRQVAKVFLAHQVDRYKKKYGEYPSELRLACSWNSGSITKQMPSDYLKKYTKFEEM